MIREISAAKLRFFFEINNSNSSAISGETCTIQKFCVHLQKIWFAIMIIGAIKKKEWCISDDRKQVFSAKRLREFLYPLNKISGGSYFFVDYYHQELIIDSPKSRILFGYPKELALKEGLLFFKNILTKEEMKWQKKLLKLIANVFFSLEEAHRLDFVILQDTKVKTSSGEEQSFHFKIIPFQLCENGNLWIALGCISSAISQEAERNVCLLNWILQARFDLVNQSFVEKKIVPLTQDEIKMLEMFVKNMLEEDICEAIGLKKGKYHYVKNKLFEKLEVDTPAGAVQRAHHLGLI